MITIEDYKLFDLNKYHIEFKYDEIGGYWIAYLREIPTTQAIGESKAIAFKNLIKLLHEKRE